MRNDWRRENFLQQPSATYNKQKAPNSICFTCEVFRMSFVVAFCFFIFLFFFFRLVTVTLLSLNNFSFSLLVSFHSIFHVTHQQKKIKEKSVTIENWDQANAKARVLPYFFVTVLRCGFHFFKYQQQWQCSDNGNNAVHTHTQITIAIELISKLLDFSKRNFRHYTVFTVTIHELFLLFTVQSRCICIFFVFL